MNIDKLKQKKLELDTFRPLPDSLVRNLEEWFRIELTYTSNAIEGNTLTRSETAIVIEKGLTVAGKSLKEHLEATNHSKALDIIYNLTNRSSKDIEERDILDIHNMILKGIDDDNAGRYRNVNVRISGSTVIMPNPLKVPQLMEEFIDWIKASSEEPIRLAAEAHLKLVTIHPFIDGNGRTARLLMNLILLQNGYPSALIKKEERLIYINSIEKAQVNGDKSDYYKIINKAISRSLAVYLKAVRSENDGHPTSNRRLKIGEFAKASGEPISTIRYWIKEGLIIPIEVTGSGYQLFQESDIVKAREIRRLQDKRYNLLEIKNMLNDE